MPRGFEQPTSSSASRCSDIASRERTRRTRQGRHDAPLEADLPSARRESSNQLSLTLPQRPSDPQPASSGHRSPAYLQGKNPYGQILDSAEHPYRRPKPTGSAPSQIGATSEGRPRTSGSFQFQTRPEPKVEHERGAFAPDPSQPLLLPRTPAKLVSVRATRNFFESKASQNRPTNVFETAPRNAKAMGYERRVVDHSSKLEKSPDAPLIALDPANRSDDCHTSDKTVRCRPTCKPVSAAESDEGPTEEVLFPTQARRTKSSRYVREAL